MRIAGDLIRWLEPRVLSLLAAVDSKHQKGPEPQLPRPQMGLEKPSAGRVALTRMLRGSFVTWLRDSKLGEPLELTRTVAPWLNWEPHAGACGPARLLQEILPMEQEINVLNVYFPSVPKSLEAYG